MRKSADKNLSLYYILRRRLLFHKNRIILRDYVVEKLQDIISLINKHHKYSVSVTSKNLQELSEVNNAIAKFEKGELSIDSAISVILG